MVRLEPDNTTRVTQQRVWIVVPCYNEERRLPADAFVAFLETRPHIGFIFVNDGSQDRTLEVLRSLEERGGGQVQVIDQQPNQGKAEAVRQGMLHAMDNGAVYAGYFDADLATPLEALEELISTLDDNAHLEIAMGARVALLGREIVRSPLRHYAGRAFATAASLVLALPVYDTQCGAKLFRCSDSMREVFRTSFGSRWIFDVEILARHLTQAGTASSIYELPLKKWSDTGDSRLKPFDFVRSIGEMASLFQRYRLQRSATRLLHFATAPFTRYALIGAIGTALHYLALLLLVEGFHVSPGTASAIGASTGAAVNYVLNYHLTFISQLPHRRTLARFVVVAATAAMFNGLGVSLISDHLGVHYLAAQVFCTLVVLVSGYLVNRHWTFEPNVLERPRSPMLLAWVAVRVPAILAALFLLREPILAWIERRFDIIDTTLFVIDVASTPVTRIIGFVTLVTTIMLASLGARAIAGRRGWPLVLAVAITAVYASFIATGSATSRMLIPLVLLTTNLAQDVILDVGLRSRRAVHWFFVTIPGTELLFCRRFAQWVAAFRTGRDRQAQLTSLLALPGIVLGSVATVMCLNGQHLVALEQRLRLHESTVLIDRGDFNGIAVDPHRAYLYAVGHGFSKVRRYDLKNPTATPAESEHSTGFAQGLEHDPHTGQVFVHNPEARDVLVFDADLKLKRRIPVPNLAPGDTWLAVDPPSRTLAIASEADQQVGVPLLVVDLETGSVLDERSEQAGNLLRHGKRSVLYLSFFRRTSGLLSYDLHQRRIVSRGDTEQRIDRLAIWRSENEVLATSPVRSRVLRFDADTLASKGSFQAPFGVRVLAVDEARGLVLSGSLATGTIEVRDLRSEKRVNTFYLGPWLRSIALVHERGIAYVSSNGALYSIQYATPIRTTGDVQPKYP